MGELRRVENTYVGDIAIIGSEGFNMTMPINAPDQTFRLVVHRLKRVEWVEDIEEEGDSDG